MGPGVVRVDLGHHEGHTIGHSPGARVVDDGRPVGNRLRCELLRDAGAGREQGDVDPVERLGYGLADLHRPTVRRNRPTRRPARGEQLQFADREFALGEDLDQGPAHYPGRPDDRDGQWFSAAH